MKKMTEESKIREVIFESIVRHHGKFTQEDIVKDVFSKMKKDGYDEEKVEKAVNKHFSFLTKCGQLRAKGDGLYAHRGLSIKSC